MEKENQNLKTHGSMCILTPILPLPPNHTEPEGCRLAGTGTLTRENFKPTWRKRMKAGGRLGN